MLTFHDGNARLGRRNFLQVGSLALGGLTLPQLLARHRDDKACAGCHRRFDSVGLVFEGYGPIGDARTKDLAGHAVDTQATFPGGSHGQIAVLARPA